jgi:hypothetical protein
MSRRHRSESVPALTRGERLAHRRAERHQARSHLSSLAGFAGDAERRDDFVEPAGYTTPLHAHTRPSAQRRSRYAHWKQPFWKRRTQLRAQRARQLRTL